MPTDADFDQRKRLTVDNRSISLSLTVLTVDNRSISLSLTVLTVGLYLCRDPCLVVWCGVVRCGMMYCDMIRYYAIRHDVI